MKNLAKMKEIQDKINKSPYFQRYKSLSAMKEAVKSNLEQLVPSAEAFKEAKKGNYKLLQEKSMAAALNAPMGLTFIGPKSASFNHEKALQAKKLIAEGADPTDIWRSHRIGFMDKDLNLPFSEVSDKNLKINSGLAANQPSFLRGLSRDVSGQSKFIEHPELANEYNWKDFTSRGEEMPLGYNGAYVSGNNSVILNTTNPLEKMREAAAHELQHAVQQREGWPGGGSPNSIDFTDLKPEDQKLISGIWKMVDDPKIPKHEREFLLNDVKEYMTEAKFDAYERLTGEAMARETANRINYSDLQRANTYPLAGGQLGGTKLEDLIFKAKKQIPNKSETSFSTELPPTKFSLAQQTAHNNAILPKEQGGLGLPPGNTPMDRAKAMGFDLKNPQYHGTFNDFSVVDPDLGELGLHTGSVDQANKRVAQLRLHANKKIKPKSESIMPLLQKGQYYEIKDLGFFKGMNLLNEAKNRGLLSPTQVDDAIRTFARAPDDKATEVLDNFLKENVLDRLKEKGYSGFKYNNAYEGGGTSYIHTNSSSVRSRHAAFDPFNADSNDIMASIERPKTIRPGVDELPPYIGTPSRYDVPVNESGTPVIRKPYEGTPSRSDPYTIEPIKNKLVDYYRESKELPGIQNRDLTHMAYLRNKLRAKRK